MDLLESNLAALEQTAPGAGGAGIWTSDDEWSALPELAVPRDGKPIALPRAITAVGARWPIAHVADRVTLEFATAPPAGHSAKLQVFDGRRWVNYGDDLKITANDHRIELSFAPVATRMLRVRLADTAGLFRIDIHRYLAEAKTIEWPARVTSGELARQILARPEDPSFESMSLYGLSMPAWAMMGLKDSGYEQAVWWDGQIHLENQRLMLALGDAPTRLANVRDTIRRHLVDGWLPAVIVEAQVGAIAVKQSSLIAFADGDKASRPATFVRVELTNRGSAAFTVPLAVELRDAPADPFLGTLGVEIHNPPRDMSASTWELKDRLLYRNGQPFLVASQSCRNGKDAGTVVFDLKLAPGQMVALELALPCKPWRPTPAEAAALTQVSFDQALRNCRKYWDSVLAPATKIALPEERLNQLYRGILVQLFINAWGDTMPYGAAPSNYDGSVYGVEESYPMRALAMFGFAADAQRYADRTYLQPSIFEKAETFTKPEQRNQQNRNGLTPTCVIEIFRLGQDRQWFGKHVELLRECADWTIANRRKTMQMEAGQKQLHHGLLPLWAYGGDLHEKCYPLFPNFACWRGLKDTAWVMEQFGRGEDAARYRREAEDYRATIMAVIDAIYRKDARPPFLPLRLDATEPDSGDFYQLFAGLLLEFMPFDNTDPRRNYLSDFLDRDNRTFCELPRFRPHECHGGIDAIYGLGHILGKLRQDRIREFLLGFYAYQAFNLEHTCYTSREQNRIYSSDRHLRDVNPVQDWSDPLPCSSAVSLLLLRHLLVTEERRGDGEYTGRLLLLHGAPRRWFTADQRITVENAAIHAGKASFSVICGVDARQISADIALPADSRCAGLSIRLRHPEGKPMRSVTINGKAATTFDANKELVNIVSPAEKTHIDALY